MVSRATCINLFDYFLAAFKQLQLVYCTCSHSSPCFLACVTELILFHAMLVILRPLVSSQLKAQRYSRVGDELFSPSSLCSSVPGFTMLSGSSATNITTLLTAFPQIHVRTEAKSWSGRRKVKAYLLAWAAVYKQLAWVEISFPQ